MVHQFSKEDTLRSIALHSLITKHTKTTDCFVMIKLSNYVHVVRTLVIELPIQV